MSSAATAGPPPGPSNGKDGGGLANEHHDLNWTNVQTNGDEGKKKMDRIMPHIDDLVNVKPDVNIHAPIRKLLLEAETLAKQADTHLDFRRPDFALQEYVKAFEIAVQIIPRHKEFPELKRTDLQQTWMRLQKRIISQGPKFEKVKQEIKENNAKSRVRPLNEQLLPGKTNGAGLEEDTATSSEPGQDHHSESQDRSGSSLSSTARPNGNAPTFRKQPPPVQPKPNALHGKTIKQPSTPPSDTSTTSANDVLTARFARLRGSESPTPTQDPRIKTRPIVPPASSHSLNDPRPLASLNSPSDRPLGPREMPRVPQGPPRPQKIPLDITITTMPRPPDAVYSPARGPEDLGNVGMPRSSSRNSYTGPARTNSMASINGALRTSSTFDDRPDYFSPTSGNSRPAKMPASPRLPDVTTVSADDLMKYINRGSQQLRLLLVDIRSREDFDAGHILANSIVCIEPIVLRKEISGEELLQTMVLSPESERDLFEHRHEFDLLVYYDQSSTSDLELVNPAYDEHIRLKDFRRAVYDYSYDEKRLKRKPMLLVGGIDAWTDLMGYQALATSETTTSKIVAKQPAKTGLSRGRPAARRRTYESRPLTKEQEIKWMETLKDEQASSPSYVRGYDEFMRKFPEIATQQSMTAAPEIQKIHKPSSTASIPPPIDSSHHEELNALMLKPPTRPSPAVPRQSFKGASDSHGTNNLGSLSTTPVGAPPVQTLGDEVSIRGRTGLTNFGNTCYLNSVLQCISATRFLSWYLMTGDFEKPENKPQRKAGELSDPPQLMARNLANLLRHIWSGQFTYVAPKTFKNYVHAIHSRSNAARETFGGAHQQDAAEFLIFVLEMLDDELNGNRHKIKAPEPSEKQMAELSRQPAISAAISEWNRFFAYDSSVIKGWFGGQFTGTTSCSRCQHFVKSWDTWTDLAVPILDARSQTLDDALRRFCQPQVLDDYKCERCSSTGGISRTQLISRCPTYMIIHLKRATHIKVKTQITFPLDNLDMTPHFVPTKDVDMSLLNKDEYKPYRPPFLYQCYAVIQHEGNTINSGHYWTLIRDTKENKWWQMEDSKVSQVSAQKTQTANSYVLFYKRV